MPLPLALNQVLASAVAAAADSPSLLFPPRRRRHLQHAAAAITKPGSLRCPRRRRRLAVSATAARRGCRKRAKLAPPLPPHHLWRRHILLLMLPRPVSASNLAVAAISLLLLPPPHRRWIRHLVASAVIAPSLRRRCCLDFVVISVSLPPSSPSRHYRFHQARLAPSLAIAAVSLSLLLAPHHLHLSVLSLLPSELQVLATSTRPCLESKLAPLPSLPLPPQCRCCCHLASPPPDLLPNPSSRRCRHCC